MTTPVWTYAKLVALLQYLAQLALGIGGTIAMGFIVFYGVKMATARDNATQFGEARGGLIKACLGLLIILGAWSIIATIHGAVNSIGH